MDTKWTENGYKLLQENPLGKEKHKKWNKRSNIDKNLKQGMFLRNCQNHKEMQITAFYVPEMDQSV